MVKKETTIRISPEAKEMLDKFRQFKSESYEGIIRKLAFIAESAEKNPKLSQKTALNIKEAREIIKMGGMYSVEESKKILGVKDGK